jgi:hypothetical protein
MKTTLEEAGFMMASSHGEIVIVPTRDVLLKVHPHSRIIYTKQREKSEMWYAADHACIKGLPLAFGGTLQMIKVRTKTSEKLSNFLGEQVPKEINFVMPRGKRVAKMHVVREDAPQTKFARLMVEGTLTAIDIHNLYFHETEFSELSENPELCETPVEYIKKILNLPERL